MIPADDSRWTVELADRFVILASFAEAAREAYIHRGAEPVAEGFHYSPGFAQADFVWDEAKLDAWLTNPQEVIPGVAMSYRQSKPESRAAVIAYLKELK